MMKRKRFYHLYKWFEKHKQSPNQNTSDMLANTMLPPKHTIHTIIMAFGNSELMQSYFKNNICNNKMVGHETRKTQDNKVGQN